ncbi:hypothetical protein PIB30_088623, partial [Stylosanthes scabra]|nr:hypothetical protein [Stylosanthes scabra]
GQSPIEPAQLTALLISHSATQPVKLLDLSHMHLEYLVRPIGEKLIPPRPNEGNFLWRCLAAPFLAG